MTEQEFPPGFEQIPPKKLAKQLKKHFRYSDYQYIRSVFRHVRIMLDIKVDLGNKKLPYVPSGEDLKKFYDVIWHSCNSSHIVMIKVLLYTGARVNELVNMKLTDVNLDRCQIRINQGKGGKDRIVPFPIKFRDVLNMHINDQMKRKAQYLFESSWRRKYTTRGIRCIFAKYSKLADIERPISPHKLRHFLFTWLKKQGIDDAMIQPYSGHASRTNLELYSRMVIKDAQDKYNEVIDKFLI